MGKKLTEETKKFRKVVGNNILTDMGRLGIETQSEFARKCNFSRNVAHRLINGETGLDEIRIYALLKNGFRLSNIYKGVEKSADNITKEFENGYTIDKTDEENYVIDYIVDHPELIVEYIEKVSSGGEMSRIADIISICANVLKSNIKN